MKVSRPEASVLRAAMLRTCGRCRKTASGYIQRDPSVAEWLAAQPVGGCAFCLPARSVEERAAEKAAFGALVQASRPDE